MTTVGPHKGLRFDLAHRLDPLRYIPAVIQPTDRTHGFAHARRRARKAFEKFVRTDF